MLKWWHSSPPTSTRSERSESSPTQHFPRFILLSADPSRSPLCFFIIINTDTERTTGTEGTATRHRRNVVWVVVYRRECIEQMMITESQEATAAGVDFCALRFANWMPAFVNKKKSFYQQIKTTDCWRNKHKLQGIEINAKSAAQWVCYLAYMLWTMMCLVLFIRTGQTISFCTIAHNWF